MSGLDWEYLYGELLQSTADQKGIIDYLEERRAALEAEAERLRGELKHQGSVLSRMVDLWESSSPPTTRPDWLRSALAALDEEVGGE